MKNVSPDVTAALLPYQADLVAAALDPKCPPVTLLRRELGLGGNYTLTVAAITLLRDNPQAKILFLAGRIAIADQVAERVRLAGVSGGRMDRFRFRELVASESEQAWPSGSVTIMTYDFAKQADVVARLAAHWDLVIAEDADYATGARARALLEAANSSRRCIVALAMEPPPELSSLVDEASVVVWRRDALLQGRGAGESSFAPEINLVRYKTTEQEMALAEAVDRLNEALSAEAGHGLALGRRDRLHASNPAGLDDALTRILTGKHPLPEREEANDSESEPDWHSDPPSVPVVQAAMEAMRKLNDASQDSRLLAFTHLVEDDLARSISSLRICVVASSRAALYYLSSQLEYLGIQHQLLHSAMSPADQADSLASFLDEGGVLLATFPVLKGIGLPTVTDLVLYDLPGSRTVAAVVIGVFDCIGRTKRLRIHLLAPANEPPGTDALSSVRSALIHGDPSAL